MTGLQSPCRAQCMYRHCPSLVLQGKCCFLLVATGSGLSFLCRLEAMSSVSAAGSQQPARPSLAVQMEKRLSGSSQKIPKTGGNHPWDMGSAGSCRPCWGSRALCWLHQAWGNQNHVSPIPGSVSRPGQMGLWPVWSLWRVSLPVAVRLELDEMLFKVPSDPYHSMMLWFFCPQTLSLEVPELQSILI